MRKVSRLRSETVKERVLPDKATSGVALVSGRPGIGISLASDALCWYDSHARRLPWRVPPGSDQRPNPYHVLLSEFLLQQTTVKAVVPYFLRFVARWPTLRDLARAPLEHVLEVFAGLGYYRRARYLHACACYIVDHLGEEIPKSVDRLQRLPGVGPYVASAVASIAFGVSTPVVDGNIARVASRLFGLYVPFSKLKTAARTHMARSTPQKRPGDFAQAMMDLGSSVCTVRKPTCETCPISQHCWAYAHDEQEDLPVRKERIVKPERTGYAFVLFDRDGNRILLYRRSETDLLGGMISLPCTSFSLGHAKMELPSVLRSAPVLNWQQVEATVSHTFTHFDLTLRVCVGSFREDWPPPKPYFWCRLDPDVSSQALPSLMRKVLRSVLRESVSRF